jgi:hypothetical protein
LEQEEVAVTGQRQDKQFVAATNQRATIEEMLEAVISTLSLPRLGNEDQQQLV